MEPAAKDLVEEYLDDAMSRQDLDRLVFALTNDTAEGKRFLLDLAFQGRLAQALCPDDPVQVQGMVMNRLKFEMESSAIARRVLIRLRPWYQNPWLATTFAAAAMLMVVCWLAFAEASKNTNEILLQSYTGQVEIVREGKKETVRKDQPLKQGDYISTLEQSQFVVRYPDTTTVTLMDHSQMVLGSMEKTKQISLQRGQLQANEPPESKTKLLIDTPHCHFQVLGTTFRVQAEMTRSLISVEQGSVSANPKMSGVSTTLVNGQSAFVDSKETVMVDPSGLALPEPSQIAKIWPDRRPFGTIFLGRDHVSWPGNPRGWFNDETLDLRTVQGKNAFQQRLDERINMTISNLRSLGAQGLIFWDLEGLAGEGYHGNPRNLAKLAPEMDSVADAMFNKIGQAGLSSGLCLAPQDGLDALSAAKDLALSVEWCQKRWKTSVFVILERSWQGPAARASMLVSLHRLCPDKRFIIEGACEGDWPWGAPLYRSATPPWASEMPSGAVSSLMISDLDSMQLPRLRNFLKQGHIALVRAWSPGSPDLELLKQALQSQ